MIQLLIPFIIGVALGNEPPPRAGTMDAPAAEAEVAAPVAEAETAEATASEATARTPEEQIPTGKFTTAIEIKSILGMTKQNWVAVRLYEGNDLVYFSHLLAWRCGLWEIRYSVNGAEDLTTVPMEPCHEDTAQPNALTDVVNFLPYITLPPESVESVYVEILYDDGTSDFAVYQRQNILLP